MNESLTSQSQTDYREMYDALDKESKRCTSFEEYKFIQENYLNRKDRANDKKLETISVEELEQIDQEFLAETKRCRRQNLRLNLKHYGVFLIIGMLLGFIVFGLDSSNPF